jgi:hypothetical protein
VAKVALQLLYEGDAPEPLAVGSLDNFSLELDVHPATLRLAMSLGNLVAEYGALPAGHPNRTMVSVRDAQHGSLIEVLFRCADAIASDWGYWEVGGINNPHPHMHDVCGAAVYRRMHSVEQSFIESRVPSGLSFMSVGARLSTVQVVFMNRFLAEFLDYLAGVTVQLAAC